uniref:Putative secreted protein n=1 Tax=Anopheles darlingi TaxID=43151 RepID=A0A2M4DE37_ANODA
MVSRSLMPFSSMSIVFFSIRVVFSMRSSTGSNARCLYRSVRNSVLISVDLPRPISPQTMSVNSKPRFTDFRCTCSASVEKPI